MNTLEKAFEYAKETFARKGVDVMEALRKLETIPLSLHAWQGDDVTGFDNPTHALTGGCQVTGNYPGRARTAPRMRLLDSLDKTFQEPLPESQVLDAVESKLFGIGAESCTVGSHDFYLTYAARNRKLICLDSGHFHPTESVADKLSSLCCQQGRILLHVSRGVRWDSDHVLALNDELLAIAHECVHCCTPQDIHIALDYFDASINRIAAWVIGARNWQKALLIAMLTPMANACDAEDRGDFTSRMAIMEAQKTLPWNAVWNYYCESRNVPADTEIMKPIREYEHAAGKRA